MEIKPDFELKFLRSYIDSTKIGLRHQLALVREPKIRYLALKVFAYQNIPGGQVAMQKTLAGQVFHSFGHLKREKQQVLVIERQVG